MIRELAGHRYSIEPLVTEDFENLDRWVLLEDNGKWTARDRGVDGEWIKESPSMFFREKIAGDFMWEIDATRMPPDSGLIERYSTSKWNNGDMRVRYNFNFWIRADVPPPPTPLPGSPPTPPQGTFFEEYPRYLKTGWNGMGDDHWHSYFNTIVWLPDGENWIRLRRGPGYEMREDIHNVVPHLPYGQKNRFTFVVASGRVRLYFNERKLVYDHLDLQPHQEGYIGLCVWICKTRFERMRVWRIMG